MIICTHYLSLFFHLLNLWHAPRFDKIKSYHSKLFKRQCRRRFRPYFFATCFLAWSSTYNRMPRSIYSLLPASATWPSLPSLPSSHTSLSRTSQDPGGNILPKNRFLGKINMCTECGLVNSLKQVTGLMSSFLLSVQTDKVIILLKQGRNLSCLSHHPKTHCESMIGRSTLNRTLRRQQGGQRLMTAR